MNKFLVIAIASIACSGLGCAEDIQDLRTRFAATNRVLSTNEYGPITITNSIGAVLSNAFVTRIEPTYLIYRLPEGGGGRLDYSAIPESVRTHFAYDSDAVELAIEKEKQKLSEKRQRDSEERLQLQAELAQKEISKHVQDTSVVIFGRVIQRIDRNLLINGDSQVEKGVSEEYLHQQGSKIFEGLKLPPHWTFAHGILLLRDYSAVNRTVDGDIIMTVAYPVGTYQYETVRGSSSTIRKYTADADWAAILATAGLTEQGSAR